MGALTLAGFAIWCLLAIFATPWSVAMLVLFFPLEQVLQASSGIFRDTAVGLRMANYSVGFVVLISLANALRRRIDRLEGTLQSGSLWVYALYLWTAITLAWSPGAKVGSETLLSALPYLVLFLVFVPIMIVDLDEWSSVAQICFLIGTAMCGLILTSPEFTVVYGRLGLTLSTAAVGSRSSPLALGELGGTMVVLAAVFGSGQRRVLMNVARFVAALAGTILVVKSGSRGQLFFAIATIAFAYPLAKPIVNARNLILAAIGFGVLLALIFYVAGKTATSGSYETEQRWAEGATSQGVDVRAANISFLLSTWARSPTHWFQGLGFYSFNALNPYGEPYTHSIFVDAFGETGLIGAALYLLIAISTFRSARWLFMNVREDPAMREKLGTLLALIIYQVLLGQKQGNIVGSFLLFALCILTIRIERRMRAEIESADASGEPEQSQPEVV